MDSFGVRAGWHSISVGEGSHVPIFLAVLNVLACTGGDGGLDLIMGTYQPSITCRGALPSWRNCAAVLYGMQASTHIQVFGDREDPGSEVVLPAIISAGKKFIPNLLLHVDATR